MNPDQILAALAEVYATCGSYRDSGRVVTRFLDLGGRLTDTSVKPFRTAFVRPDRFRFEYRDEDAGGGRCIVWSDGEATRTWWYVTPGVEEHESLGLAVAGATGVSGESAHTVPALLLPDRVRGRRLTDLGEVVSLGDERLDEVTCYRLQGRFAADPAAEERHRQEVLRLTGQQPERCVDGPVTLWIDRGTFLVRRIEDHAQFETFRIEKVTTYEPATGITISEEELRFDPPG
jgi:hypothetical protein